MSSSFDITKLVRPNILSMKPYSSARDEFTDFSSKMVFLDANENPFETSVNRYPDPQQKKVKEIWAALDSIATNQLLLGNGSDEVLDLLFRAFCQPGVDNIVTVPPTYGMYDVLAQTNAIQNRKVLLDSQFQIKEKEIIAHTDENTKLIFICSPNNPTGNSIRKDKISFLLDHFNGLVVIDEAYIDFSDNNSWVTQLSNYPNLVITKTLSKAYGQAGIRLGICIASPSIIEILHKIKPPYNVNELTQAAALSRLLNHKKVASEIKQIIALREALEEALKPLSFVETVFPSDANFILTRVDDATKRYNQLLAKGIVVRNRSSQPLCENTLRFTIGTRDENEILIKALKELE